MITMKNKILIIVLFFVSCISVKAQTALTTRIKTQLYDKSYNIIPVYKCTGNTLEYYTDVYAGETLEKFNVKMPDLSGCSDTGYAFIYFSGFERAACKNYSVVIIGNAQSMYKPKLFFDHNHNLDFTDDGPSIEFDYNKESIEFDLCNANETTGCLHYRLSRYRLENQYTLRKNLDDFFTFNAGTKKYLGLTNSFRIQCMNQWGADVKIGNDSFRIAVEDHNINGLYNEAGIDHISLVPYGTEPISNDVNEGSVVLPKTGKNTDSNHIVLQHLSESYIVSGITANGQTLTIKYNGKHKRAAERLVNKRAPRFSYELLAYRKYAKLRKYRGTPVYIFFYNFKTADSTTFKQLKKLYEASNGKLKIITLNYGNNPTMVKEFVQQNYYMWSNGLATKKIYQRYKVDQLPMGFYLNKKLRVLKVGITPQEMLQEFTH
jgi:hypothetical protein